MIVCSVRKNDCHSERSEEPPHFAFALAVVLAFVFIRSRQESSSRPEAAHLAAAVERPPHSAVVVVLAFAVVRSFRPPTQRIVISTEAVHSLIVGRVVEKSASLPWFPQATTPWPSSLLSFLGGMTDSNTPGSACDNSAPVQSVGRGYGSSSYQVSKRTSA